jgi:hypothetical protein
MIFKCSFFLLEVTEVTEDIVLVGRTTGVL